MSRQVITDEPKRYGFIEPVRAVVWEDLDDASRWRRLLSIEAEAKRAFGGVLLSWLSDRLTVHYTGTDVASFDSYMVKAEPFDPAQDRPAS